MTNINFVEILVYLAIIVAITPVLGGYMAKVFAGERRSSTRCSGRSSAASTASAASTP